MQFPKSITRRSILGGSALVGTLATAIPFAKADHHGRGKKANLLSHGKTILFQGDSITDAGRDKKRQVANEQKSFGRGYAWMAASQLLISNPEMFYKWV